MSSRTSGRVEVTMQKASPLSATSKGGLSRRRILESARRCFATEGYERTTIRRIADDAAIDKSSVMKYFGTKEALFRECVRMQTPLIGLEDDDAVTLRTYVRSVLRTWEADPYSPVAVLLRTSTTSELAADLLRDHLTRMCTDVVEQHVDADEARLRAVVFTSVVVGLASGRHVVALPELADADLDRVVDVVVPMLTALLAH